MSDRGFDYSDRRYIPISGNIAARLAIREGDFFVSRGNGTLKLVGRGTLAQSTEELIVFPDTMIRLRFAENRSLKQYMAAIWASHLLRKQIVRKARTTAGIYKISQRDIDGFAFALPPESEQQEIVREIEERLSSTKKSEEEIERSLVRSTRLRQAILKHAFDGRLSQKTKNSHNINNFNVI